MSERLRVDPNAVAAPALNMAAEILSNGGLVVSPTETRYGILARADRREVLERLYRVKARNINKPTSVLVAQPEDIGRLGKINRPAELMIGAFLPGPLTLVLASLKEWFPPAVVDEKIGLRCSSMLFVNGLVTALDMPLTATSANRAGGSEFESVDEIETEFGDEIDLYLDAGPLTGKTSTVVDCSGKEPVILREGAISRNNIEAVLR
jgi:L-threonylcarbamoyladenylate synthase